MTIAEAISKTDTLRPNGFTLEQKRDWLSELDGRVKHEIIDFYEGGDETPFTGYREDTPNDTVLMIAFPYDEIYVKWLISQIDYYSNEYQKYNNSAYVFNALYDGFAKQYGSCHTPKGSKNRFVF